uniref:WbsW n=5 Tax=Escherichia coli TaxID=562 RepID=B5L3G0_ECOLX|nr:WbsW [Escherichia coli]
MKITILVVLYNKKFEESTTLQTILSEKHTLKKMNVELCIHDNSPNSQLDECYISEMKEFVKCYYTHTPENMTLREIYNNIINTLKYNTYLCLMDDDTSLPQSFFNEVISAINNNPDIELIVPRVIVNDKLYSPHKSYSFINRPTVRDIKGIQKSKNMSAINSGMVIKSNFFKRCGFKYPEYTSYYGTDKVFFDHYLKYNQEYYVLDIDINHDVSNHPYNKDDVRYSQIISSVNFFWMQHLKGNYALKFLYIIYIILYRIKLSILRKNLIFIKSIVSLGNK